MIPFALMTAAALASVSTSASVSEADAVRVLHPSPAPDADPAVRIAVPYTFGTHDVTARKVRGDVRVDMKTLRVVSGRLWVPIDALISSNKTMECHMREALGLDYAKSKFPNEHVCKDNKIPSSGNDAVVFPEIVFALGASKPAQGAPPPPVGAGQSVRVTVPGRWTIHGIARDSQMDLKVTSLAPRGQTPVFRVTGRATLRLSDYGIRVKPAMFIKVGDEVTLDFNLVIGIGE